MQKDNKFIIRCRAIILNGGKMLFVRHTPDKDFLALPGGHLEWGEDVKECLLREIMEELGVEPKIGRLLYINTFFDGKNVQPMEFFFEVTNGEEYIKCEKLERTHSHELDEIVWLSSNSDTRILPEQLGEDFRAGTIISDNIRYIKN